MPLRNWIAPERGARAAVVQYGVGTLGGTPEKTRNGTALASTSAMVTVTPVSRSQTPVIVGVEPNTVPAEVIAFRRGW